MNNPYRGLFKLDEEIASAKSEAELYKIRWRIYHNKRYRFDTIRMICLWIHDRLSFLRGHQNGILDYYLED